MPDITRSDSHRSDASLRPRVSFNRDVHVKRIVSRENGRIPAALSGDGGVHLIPTPVRKERIAKSKQELAKEAARVINQVDKIDCVTKGSGVYPEKFNTLPVRKKQQTNSLDRRPRRRNSNESIPPKKPPRTFTAKPSVFNVFPNESKPKKSNLRRSISDASNLKSKNVTPDKKQLSPIIEVTQREDYFTTPQQSNLKPSTSFKENNQNSQNVSEKSITEKLKEYIDEVDSAIYKDTGVRYIPPKAELKEPEVFIIDVDNATKISGGKTSKLKSKIKAITTKKIKKAPEPPPTTKLQAITSPAMKKAAPVGKSVNTLVKKLSLENTSPPPKTTRGVMVTPNMSVQHNNNQPFSYTRGLSPEKNPPSPIIYAQVVCGNGTGGKQTIHTAYMNGSKKHLPHSDSDEGLGYEENSAVRSEKSITHFGDEKYYEEEEFPIKPSFKSFTNGFYGKSEGYIDSSSRGRGDGMDAKRRESITEQLEPTPNKYTSITNGRMDVSARRDLLESRIHRRLEEKHTRISPEYSSPGVYITEKSRYYRSGSNSPAGLNKNNYNNKRYLFQSNKYSYEQEPKSFDSQASDYRSSPENRHFETSHRSSQHSSRYQAKSDRKQLAKDRSYHKSNPEINANYSYDINNPDFTYHDSLKKNKNENVFGKKDFYEYEKKDKFGDSGIENDFRRDSGERRIKRREFSNESEDEGFASSLLITNERQHTDDNFRKLRRGYESEDGVKGHRSEYVPRERSIDDGSHFDPHIDKNFNKPSTLKRVDKKPPKPEKKSSLEKMKQLFTSKKKKDKPGMVREESLRARYVEYKGGENKMNKKDSSDSNAEYDYNGRRRLSTPSPSPTREVLRNGKSESSHGSWFKSLDRLARKKTKKDGNLTEDEVAKPTKNLRFFGDTDIESNDSDKNKSVLKTRNGFTNRGRSQSTRDLHNISEESYKTNHKSMLNISPGSDRDVKGSRLSLKPPASPSHRSREISRTREDRNRRRKNEVSSIESSTEGDSSQQSQRSIVYLHAATVGDIPGPGYLRNGRRAASREELASNCSSRIQPQVKTLSRSFSVLAPWKPRHPRESMDIDYTQYPKPIKNNKYEQNKNASSRKESSTLKKRAQETRKNNQNTSTLNRRSRSKENISSLKRAGEYKGSSLSLYKKKERQPKENNRYSSNRDESKRMAHKSMSVESLGSSRNGRKGEVSRSISMPRDPEKSAGWFSMNKKNKNKSVSTQRL